MAGLREAGLGVPDAQGNFVWLATGEQTTQVAAALRRGGLIARPFAGDGVRISVGEDESVENSYGSRHPLWRLYPRVTRRRGLA